MACFPMCVDLNGQTVLLVGSGPQVQDKADKLAGFGAELRRLDALRPQDLSPRPAFVVAGDLPLPEAERTAALCARHGVPVNVVDVPRLCSFTFPALVVRGSVTVAISTGGKAPSAAACLKKRVEACLPENTGEILDWLAEVRAQVRQAFPGAESAPVMRRITAAAFEKGAALTCQEWMRIAQETRAEE